MNCTECNGNRVLGFRTCQRCLDKRFQYKRFKESNIEIPEGYVVVLLDYYCILQSTKHEPNEMYRRYTTDSIEKHTCMSTYTSANYCFY